MHRPAKFKNFLLHCIKVRAAVLVDTPKCARRQNPAHPMQAFYSDQFVLPLPPGHRFPMPKYRLLRDRIDGDLGTFSLSEAIAKLQAEVAAKTVRQVADGGAPPPDRGTNNEY